MKSNSLFKHQSIVAIVLVIGAIIAPNANAQKSSSAYTTDQTPEKPDDNLGDVSGGQDSSSILKAVNSILDGSRNTDPCASQNSRVDSLSQQQSSSQSQLIDAQESAESEALKARQKAQQDALAQDTETSSYQAQSRALAAQLVVDTNDANSKTAQALQKIRDQVLALDDKLNQARAQLRAAADAIVNTNADMESACRAAADDAGNQKKNAIDQAYAASKAAKVQINYAADSLAGADARRKTRRLVDIQNEYMTAYKNCMAGSSAKGAEAVANVKKVQQAYVSAQAAFNDQIASLSKMQTALKQDLAQAQQDGQNALSAVKLKAATQLDALTTQYTQKMKQLQLDANQQLEAASLSSKYANQRISLGMTTLQNSNLNLSKATASADACNISASSSNAALQDKLKQLSGQPPASASNPSAAASALPACTGNPGETPGEDCTEAAPKTQSPGKSNSTSSHSQQ